MTSQTTAGIGLVLPFDSALDREYWGFMPGGVDLYIARTPHASGPLGVPLIMSVSEPDVVLGVAADMASALDPALVAYGCTSGSFLRGLEACRQLTLDMESKGCRRAGSTSDFLIDALNHLGVSEVGVATPYDDEMTGLLIDFLSAGGVRTDRVVNLGMRGDPKTVSPERVFELAMQADSPKAEAIFLSCTNLRTFDLIEALEDRLQKPVLTANQVTIWGALKRANFPMPSLPQRLFA